MFRTLLRHLGTLALARLAPGAAQPSPSPAPSALSAAAASTGPPLPPASSPWAWPDGEPLEATQCRLQAAAAAEVRRRYHPSHLAPGYARDLAQGRQP